MRIFKNKAFTRFARRSGIVDETLCEAIHDAKSGLIDADLGGGVIKQRIARPGQGKSGGFRTMILFKKDTRAFFVHGFAKNAQGNIRHDELVALRKLASNLLTLDNGAVARLIASGTLMEVACDA